ncbi:hypothetical protein HOP61_19695 [Halomonas daqingensis]|uniref:Tail fiber protein n=1 Tax=Billgrantia desiderata TaxID=52021 RepID=A0AAW4Z1C1_9GAMM|nr:hypothetical protein [Halomonas desiderata]MCE8053521.1 hypothetical protein [Halomonas desiderata]
MAINNTSISDFRTLVNDWRSMYEIATEIVTSDEYIDVVIESGEVRPTLRKFASDRMDEFRIDFQEQFDDEAADREIRFSDFLVESGYTLIGEYTSGITFTEYNQMVRYDGEFWRPSSGLALPYTTTGAGMPESNKFVSIGDNALRKELAINANNLIRVNTLTGNQTLREALDARVEAYTLGEELATNANELIRVDTETGNQTIQEALDSRAEKAVVDAIFPTGVIVMWSGVIDNIPLTWALCDGEQGTPDLRDRFIVGAGSSYAVGDTGGANAVTLTINQMPSHEHTGSTNSAGAHTHNARGRGSNGTSGLRDAGGSYTSSDATTSSGTHSHSLEINEAGGDQPHENRPPYFALAYIMKL